MKKISFLFFLLNSLIIIAQSPIQEKINSRLVDLHKVADNDENFAGFEQIKKEIGDAQIVMLGEQSHSDATTYETKIKLIKYLHQEMDFDILAFESNIYECDKAWAMIEKGHDVKDALGKGMFSIWAGEEELNPLFKYVEQQFETKNPLMFAGFDPQFGGGLSVHFEEDLTSYLATFEDASLYKKEIQQLQSLINRAKKGKRTRKKKTHQNIAFLEKLIALIKNKQNNELSLFWVQTLKSLKVFSSDSRLGTQNRDQQMAENLIWLKEKYPNKKIICWGATSHFLYNSSLIKMEDKKLKKIADDYYQNHSLMGDYLKKKYGDKLYTIGFIAHEGSYGYFRIINIESPKKNSLEYLIGQSSEDNYFLPLKDITLEGYLSRPLAHQNMTTDIAQVMDGVVFNRHMKRTNTDWVFYLYLNPDHPMRAKKKERFIRGYKLEKENARKKKIKEEENKKKAKA